MHTNDKIGKLCGGADQFILLDKDTLFNLHIKATAPQSRHVLTAVDMTLSLPLKWWGTVVSTAVLAEKKRMKTGRMNESISHQGCDNLKNPQNQTQLFKWAQRAFFSTIKGVTLVLRCFEMLIVFSAGFSPCFQHEIPRGNNERRLKKKERNG